MNQKPISEGGYEYRDEKGPKAQKGRTSVALNRRSYGNRLKKSVHNGIRANLLRLH